MEIIIRNTASQPIYEQIASQLKSQIIAGTLQPGEVLPSIRRTGCYSLSQSTPHSPPEVSPGGLAKLILATRKVMLEAGNSPLDVREATRNIYETWCIPVPSVLMKQLPGQLSLFDRPALEQ